MFVKLLMIFWHIRQKPYRCGRFSGSFPQPHICERLFAMANSFKQNCMRQFATAKSPSGIARGNSPRRTAPNRIARDNSPWRTAPNRIARDNSPWRTVITKNGTAIRHGEQPLQKMERQFATANSHYKKTKRRHCIAPFLGLYRSCTDTVTLVLLPDIMRARASLTSKSTLRTVKSGALYEYKDSR